MFWFFFLFPPQETFCIFVIVSFYFPLSPPHFSFLFSILDLTSPLKCLFFPLFCYNLECISKRPHLFAIIHAGQICCTHTHTTTTTIKWVSSDSFIGLSPIQHLCSETRTISILHKQPYLELSHRCILCMHLGSYRAYFQYVYMYTLRAENIWPEKDSQNWLCCDFSKLDYFSL